METLLETVCVPLQYVQHLFVRHVWLFLPWLTLSQYHYMTTANVSSQADSLPLSSGLNQERRLSIKLEVSRRWPEADSSPICKLSVFIYLLLNDPTFKPGGLFFSRLWKKKTTLSFFLLIICHWHIKVMDWSNFEWKVFSTLEMDAFESLPFNTNKCLCHSCPLRHTWTHILPLPTVHTFSPSSLSTQLSLPPCFNQSNANPSQHYMG